MNFLQRAQQKELTFGELLTLTKEYMTATPGRILSHMLLFMLPMLGLGILFFLLAGVVFLASIVEMSTLSSSDYSGIAEAYSTILPLIGIVILPIALLFSWHYGSVTNWLYKDTGGEQPGFKVAAKIGLKRTLRLFGTQLLIGLIVGVLSFLVIFVFGFIFGLISSGMSRGTTGLMFTNFIIMFLPIILGVITIMVIAVYFAFSQHIAALQENTGPWRAIKASIHLVKGRFWRVLGRILLAGILVMALDTILKLLLGVTAGVHEGLGIIAWVAYLFIMFAVGIAATVYTYFMYISLDSSKPEKEGVVS